MEGHELAQCGVEAIGEGVRARFMEWHHLPIVDVDVPCSMFEARWPEASARLRSLLEGGNRIFVCSRGGLGRAGMISARLLVEMGADADQAIDHVRKARSSRAIETPAQEAWVRRGRTAPAAVVIDGARDRAVGALVGCGR
jgi:ADP-ribosyl-[dinitrogen reductase] hydrolase